MKTERFSIVLLLILLAFQSYSQTKWSLVSKEDLTVNPFKNILKIQPIDRDTTKGGTGFFISKTCLLTNRHLVWNSNKKEIHQSILISSGFIGYNETPLFGSQKIILEENVNVFLPENFLQNGNDFAMIKLPNDSLYNLASQNENSFPFRLTPFSVEDLNNDKLHMAGFTGWRSRSRKKPKGRLYYTKAKYIKSLSNGEIRYRASSVRGGNSGSPIWIKDGETYAIVGIHRRGAATFPEIFGRRHGVGWTKEKIALITSWMNQ